MTGPRFKVSPDGSAFRVRAAWPYLPPIEFVCTDWRFNTAGDLDIRFWPDSMPEVVHVPRGSPSFMTVELIDWPPRWTDPEANDEPSA